MPGFPRIKEWAYAGAVITYASAVASHMIVGDGIGRVVAPSVLLALTLVSWALRPPRLMSRRPRAGADEHRP
jgi:DoxX-like family